MTVTIKLEDDKGNVIVEAGDKEYRGFAKPIHWQKMLSVIRKEIHRNENQNE